MAFKEKLLGIVLILIGIFPFLLKISSIANFFANYKFLSYIVPGEIAYQIIIIIIGILLIWKPRSRVNRNLPYK